jgi:hypothetical protein
VESRTIMISVARFSIEPIIAAAPATGQYDQARTGINEHTCFWTARATLNGPLPDPLLPWQSRSTLFLHRLRAQRT